MFAAINEIEIEEYERKKNFTIIYSSEWSDEYLKQKEKERKKQEETALFSHKEIEKMPKEFKKDFKAGRVTAHVRRRENGTFEIRCQYHRKKITASAKTLDEAKERFIARLETPEEKAITAKTIKFKDYAEKWLMTAKKPFVKAVSFKHYQETLQYAYKAFGNQTVKSYAGSDTGQILLGVETGQVVVSSA